jgi:hypothetical protein
MPLSFTRLAALASLAALAACSAGAQPSMPASSAAQALVTTSNGEHVVRFGGETIRFGGSQQRANAKPGWIARAAHKKALLYGSSYDGGFINIYSQKGTNQAPIGQLTSGLTSPQGIVVDKHHQLWVANTNAFNVVAFKRGATTPFTTLNDPNYFPIGVAVDKQGTVYAANAESTTGPPGNVTYWKKGSTNPSGTLTYSGFQLVLGIGVDSKSNVYVTYIPTSGPPAIAEFPAGSQTAQPLSLSDTTISDITFDSSSDLVMEDGSGGLGIWTPPYNGGPSKTFAIFGNEPTFDKKEQNVWIAYANPSIPKIEGYSYTTGALIDTITNGWTTNGIPYGVALDPAAPL